MSEDAQTASVLAPLRDALGRVERQVSTLERDRARAVLPARRAPQPTSPSTTDALRAQTASLAGSLNASTVRGTWGEVQLRRVLEHAGMLARCDFDEQVSARQPPRPRHPPRRGRAAARRQVPRRRRQVPDDGASSPRRPTGSARPSASGCSRRTPRRCARTSTRWPPRPTGRRSRPRRRWSSASSPATRSSPRRCPPSPGCSTTPCPARWSSPPPAPCWRCCAPWPSPGSRTRSTGSARQLLELGQHALLAGSGTLGRATPRRWARRCRSRSRATTRWSARWSRGCSSRRARCTTWGWSRAVIPEVRPIEQGPRPLTAAELLEALDADVARPQLRPRGGRGRAGTGRGPRARTPPATGLTGRPAPAGTAPVSRRTGQCSDSGPSAPASWRTWWPRPPCGP